MFFAAVLYGAVVGNAIFVAEVVVAVPIVCWLEPRTGRGALPLKFIVYFLAAVGSYLVASSPLTDAFFDASRGLVIPLVVISGARRRVL